MAPTIGVNLRVTGNCSQGGRKYMEDMFSVAYQQTHDQLDLEYAFFGIFDGHGGHEAASFAKDNLMKCIVRQPGFWSENDDEVLGAIKDGFIATHYAMWKNLENWPKTQSGLPSTSGTTASVAFIRRATVYVGHVGDSGIILGHENPQGKEWLCERLTQDHKPECPTELARIRGSGGEVVCKAGVPRVVWHRPKASHQGPLTRSTHIDQIPFLAVARSLGDLWSYNSDTDQFVVSPEPDVRVHHLDLSRDRCLIFGTDGLFNMLSAQEAVEIVEKAEKYNKSNDRKGAMWLNPSKYLVDHAITKWNDSRLRADNTSAVVLLLDPLGPPSSKLFNNHQPSLPYHIESFRVKDKKKVSSGLAICTRSPSVKRATTLKGMEEQFTETLASTSSSDEVPQLLQAISLDDIPNLAKNRRRSVRRSRKRRTQDHTSAKDTGFLSDREVRNYEPARPRRTRSEEPAIAEVKNESDSENRGAPMRLRSAIPFKTLRSRNVNLEELHLLSTDEPRSKRQKK